MRKNKAFQIIIDLHNSTTLFDAATTAREADRIVREYTKDQKAKRVRVYELNEESNSYELTNDLHHNAEPERRLIGFGRW